MSLQQRFKTDPDFRAEAQQAEQILTNDTEYLEWLEQLAAENLEELIRSQEL